MSKRRIMRILVTDVNNHVREFLKRELEKEGHCISCVKNGMEVLKQVQDTAAFDLVILDPELLLPYGQHWLSSVLRQDSPMPIIVHTFRDSVAERGCFGKNVQLVEKTGDSVGPLLAQIRAFAGRKNKQPSKSNA